MWVSRGRKLERARGLVAHTNSYFSEKKGKQTAFVIPAEAATLLQPGPEKNFDRQRILSLCVETRLQFLKELLLWDGTGTFGKGATYCTTNEHNAQVVQEVAVVTGVLARMVRWEPGGSRKTCWLVTLSPRSLTHAGKYTIDNLQYDGYVYCVTMPLSTVIVRRNGKVSVTGQSQQEPRWTTHFSALMNLPKARDAALAYHQNPLLDNHTFMAELTGLPRKHAKNIYLGLCYGEGGAKLCSDLGLPTRWALASGRGRERRVEHFDTEAEAREVRRERGDGFIFRAAGDEGQRIIDTFDARAPFIRQLAKRAQDVANRRGYVITGGGRHLHFPEKEDGSYDWTHKALNRIIQGTSADQAKSALVAMDAEGIPLHLQVHDDFNFCSDDRREFFKAAKIMQEIMPAEVPFRVDVEVGPSWGQIKEITP
jgi:hypothetical protein